VINGDDYFNIDANVGLAGGAVSYSNGDFDYNGKVNADDYFLIDANYNKAAVPLAMPVMAPAAVFSSQAVSAYGDLIEPKDDLLAY